MADISDLANQYARFSELVPVNRLDEIKGEYEYRMFGTIQHHHLSAGSHDVGYPGTGSFLWRGKIKFDYLLQESGEPVHFAAKFTGREGQLKYNTLRDFLEGKTEDGVTQDGVTGEDIIEVVMKRARSSEEHILYMMIWHNDYFVRGSERPDFLQRFHYENALGKGLIKLPDDDENI